MGATQFVLRRNCRFARFIELFSRMRPMPFAKKGRGELCVKPLLEFITYSTPHDAELFADGGAETQPGCARGNRIGKGHIVVVDIDE